MSKSPIDIWIEANSEDFKNQWIALTVDAKFLAAADSPAALKEALKESNEMYFSFFIKDHSVVYAPGKISVKFF